MSVSSGSVTPAPRIPGAAHRDVRRAWVSLAVLPVAFVAAMFLGDWLLTLQGYSSGETVPVSAALWAGGPALLVLIAPGAAAFFFGWRAQRHGIHSGLAPAVIGAAAIIGSIVLNVAAFAAGR